jgi:heptosyltransferase-1
MPHETFRLLIVKTSSLGDVIHNLPVLADLAAARPEIAVDWMVEEAYADLLRMHPGISRVLGVAQRRWRTEAADRAAQERNLFFDELRAVEYHAVLDTQGLLKSALLARRARLVPEGIRIGPSFASAREPLARLLYDKGIDIPAHQHAVERLRSLCAKAFGYTVVGPPNFDLCVPEREFSWLAARRYLVFLHGTARAEKRWPIDAFRELAGRLSANIDIVLPHGTDAEEDDARRIADGSTRAMVAPRMTLTEIAALLNQASLVVGVDTGLTHLAAALDTPTIALFGATPRWRYAPYWGRDTHSLGENGQPQVDEVLQVAEPFIARSDVRV